MSKKQMISQWVANRLPKDVIYFAAIRMWSNATTGKYGSTIVPEVTMDECIRRWYSSDYPQEVNHE
jgi:hypothetical protein